MSFLKKVFKAKPGGTPLGNLLRGASSSLTGGILGQGVIHNMSLAKQGTPTTAPTQNQNPDQLAQIAFNGALATPDGQKLANQAALMGVSFYWEKYKAWIIGAVIALGAFFAYKKSNSSPKRKSIKWNK